MSNGPRILVLTDKFRIVTLPNGTHVCEKQAGCDALGVEQWRELKFAEAQDIARMFRDYIIAQAVKAEKETEQHEPQQSE